jgi:phosphoglycerol transferase
MDAVIGVVALLELSPNIRYWLAHSRNPAVAARTPQQTEELGIRLQQLIMPRWDHRSATLARIGLKSLRGPFQAEGTQSLGLLGAAGFVFVVGFVLLRIVKARPIVEAAGAGEGHGDFGRGPAERTRRIEALSFIGMATLLIAISSGFGYFASAVGFRPIRSYNRMMVVLAFCVFAVMGLGATKLFERWKASGGRLGDRRLPIVVAAVVLLFGLLDQTSPRDAVVRTSGGDEWVTDGRFYAGMGAALPAGSAVLELPYVWFPENPGVVDMGAYDPVRGYLHQPQLKWSFGAMHGRTDYPPPDLLQRSGADIVDYARSLGYRAILIDRFGLEDRAAGLDQRFAADGLTAAGADSTGRLEWFDLGATGGG